MRVFLHGRMNVFFVNEGAVFLAFEGSRGVLEAPSIAFGVVSPMDGRGMLDVVSVAALGLPA